MSAALLRLVLLVSSAHALVHVYELSFSSTEQLIGENLGVSQAVTSQWGTAFRLPFGLCAVAAGWLADRWGARRMLALYLTGCSATCLVIAAANVSGLMVLMLVLGTFASIYHPAGLALLSRETPIDLRSRAFGVHGILGSIGIGGSPFLAALVFTLGGSWREYYQWIALPGALLAGAFLWQVFHARAAESAPHVIPGTDGEPEQARWGALALVIVYGALSGLIYAAYISFLPRYLDSAGITFGDLPRQSVRNYLAGGVLTLGMVGQYVAGRIARPGRLEWLFTLITLGNVPLLAWMALATGPARVVAAGALAIVFFMNQPVQNSLIAGYSPPRHRSLCFGLNFLTSFGLGSLGTWLAGHADSDLENYGTLAAIALAAALVAGVLWWQAARRCTPPASH